MTALNYIGLDGEYLELDAADAADKELCRRLVDEIARASAMGYDGYKKHLIQNGKYQDGRPTERNNGGEDPS